jgi:hypothetical protein
VPCCTAGDFLPRRGGYSVTGIPPDTLPFFNTPVVSYAPRGLQARMVKGLAWLVAEVRGLFCPHGGAAISRTVTGFWSHECDLTMCTKVKGISRLNRCSLTIVIMKSVREYNHTEGNYLSRKSSCIYSRGLICQDSFLLAVLAVLGASRSSRSSTLVTLIPCRLRSTRLNVRHLALCHSCNLHPRRFPSSPLIQ